MGFGVSILYRDPIPLHEWEEDIHSARRVELCELLEGSDYIILAAPLNHSTYHLIDSKALERIHPGAYLINVGRGSAVDERAVVNALESGRLAGYAADVFEMEDRSRSDRPHDIPLALLTDTGRTFLTPHLGSAVADARREIEMYAGRSIVQALRGECPEGAVNHPIKLKPARAGFG